MPSVTVPSIQQPTNTSPSGPGASRSDHTSVWQADNSPPDFGQSVGEKGTRFNADTNIQFEWEERKSPAKQQPQRENLKLAPSPNPNVTPTHRSEVERKMEDRMLQLTRNGGSTSRSTSPIANIRSQKATPAPLRLERKKSEKSMTDEGLVSPRKKLLNKLGFGAPMFKTNARPSQGAEPVKAKVTIYKEIPPKAAQLLGAKSMSSRTGLGKQPPSGHQRSRSDTDLSPTRSKSTGSATPSQQESSGQSRSSGHSKRSSQSKDNTPTVLVHDHDLRLLASDEVLIGKTSADIGRSLRFYDDVTPPTPPSKSKYESARSGLSNLQESSVRSHSTTDQANGEESPTRLGITGYRGRAELIHGSPTTRSVCGALSVIEEASPPIGVLPEGNADDALAPPSFKMVGNAMPFYSPSMYQDDDWPKHWPNSANSLLPGPLHLPLGPHHIDVAYHASDSRSRSRDTSKSSSASIPIFLDSANDSVLSRHVCHPRSNGIEQLPQVDGNNAGKIASDMDGAAPNSEAIVDPEELVGLLQSTKLAIDSTIRNKLCNLEELFTARLDKISELENARLEKLGSTVDQVQNAVNFTMQHQQSMQDTIQNLVEEVMRLRSNFNALRLELTGQQQLQPMHQTHMSHGFQTHGVILADPANIPNRTYGTSRTLQVVGRATTAKPETNQYFANLGQPRETPDIRHHPYFNRSSH